MDDLHPDDDSAKSEDSSSGNHRRRSSSRRSRRSSSRRSRGASKSTGSKRRASSKSKHRPASESFAPPPAPSRGTIRLFSQKRERAVFKVYLAGFLGVFALVFLRGSHPVAALGVALILPGIALVVRPPTTGLGRLGDVGVAGLLGCLLLAFLPQFYWPSAEWRIDALESFGLNFPATLSVQPWISFEAWLLALAGFAWLYAAIQWRINYTGRRWLFFWLSILMASVAGVVLWGNLAGARYPGAESATAFSFFPNRNLTANFLALGGVATFAYAMEGLRSRAAVPLIGMPASALCIAGLVFGASRAGVLLYCGGILLWFICSLRARYLSRNFKIGFLIMLVVGSLFVVSNERMSQRVISLLSPETQVQDEFRLEVYQDTVDMVLGAPVSGVGLGSFSAIFPQYRDAFANDEAVLHPESDLLWLASEGGVLAVVFFVIFLCGYVLRCRRLTEGISASYRILALVAVAIFLLHCLIDVPGHQAGTVYFAILFAALALPTQVRPKFSLRPIYGRAIGGLLVVFGLAWLAAGVFSFPWHSSVRASKYHDAIRSHVAALDFESAKLSADQWLEMRPMDWRAYFQRAQSNLAAGGNQTKAAVDFRRARFVEPVLDIVSYEEGEAWLPYDSARAISAWEDALSRGVGSRDQVFKRMLGRVSEYPEAQERLIRLSEIDPHYRALMLGSLKGEDLSRELQIELSKAPSLGRFDGAERTKIVAQWIQLGDLDSVEAYLSTYEDSLENSWWLWSQLRKDQADFDTAVDFIRANAQVPEIRTRSRDEVAYVRRAREYAVAPNDMIKGTALLYYLIEKEEYGKSLTIIDRLLESNEPPHFLHYWRAECLYQIEEYIESWYAFETYLGLLWEESSQP